MKVRGCDPDCHERDTCPKVGALGHAMCGHCPTCNLPRHHCGHLETS